MHRQSEQPSSCGYDTVSNDGRNPWGPPLQVWSFVYIVLEARNLAKAKAGAGHSRLRVRECALLRFFHNSRGRTAEINRARLAEYTPYLSMSRPFSRNPAMTP